MKYTERLLKNERFLRIQQEIREDEKDRVYCHHELEHGLDVARIAWILYLEAGACREEIKDRIYVTGLIHDIGRSVQYRTGEHHAIAGAEIARQILSEIDYPEKWISDVCGFIREHHGRQYAYSDKSQIGYYIERADKLSRNCFSCPAVDTCKWSEAEKNQTVKV